MSEYLDRKQVIELYEKYQPSLATHVYEFGEKLKALPIVKEETSRPHGEWIEHRQFSTVGYFYSEYECSNCHDEVWQKTEWQFCPNCGADMRDKKDDLVDIIEAAQSIKDRGEAE